MNAHNTEDLAQMQALPLEAKIIMTKQRIRAWYQAWKRFEICNDITGKTRFVTIDTRNGDLPTLKENEWIKEAVDGQVYVSFSGGKDSTVLKHIVDSMYDDVPSLFVNTGLEYPEIQKFAMSQKNVITMRPEMRFDEVIRKYGYPVITKQIADAIEGARRNPTGSRMKRLCGEYGGRKDGKASKFNCPQWKFMLDSPFSVSAKCCDVMKKRPAKQYEKNSGRVPFIGILASESQIRRNEWKKHGCNAFDASSPSSRPLSFWTEQDILHYIKKHNVPYCSVYGDIVETQVGLKTTDCDRTGCIFCGFGCHLEKDENRFQRMKETHPRQYEYCIGGGEFVDGVWQPSKEGLGLGKVLDYIGVKYE